MTNYIERYWRDATPADAIKEPPMVARFRDKDEGFWHFDTLSGWNCRSRDKWLSGVLSWQFCQVYDAPDPGEGYELIDITKATKQKGDEFLGSDEGWKPAHSKEFFSTHIYRRRITSAVTYVPFTWEDREQLRGRWIYRSKDGNTIEEIAFKFDSRVFNEVAKHLLEDGWHFLDTGKPVGKEVTQ